MIQKLDNAIDKVIFYMLGICLMGMLSLSVVGIVLRWFEIAFLWLEPLVRHMVFFSAFLGGALATGKGNHIRIDLMSKVLENKFPQTQKWLDRIIDLVCVFACVLLANAGYEFSKVEMQYGKEAFLGIHSGVLVSSITVGMGIIALRFLMRFFISFSKVK